MTTRKIEFYEQLVEAPLVGEIVAVEAIALKNSPWIITELTLIYGDGRRVCISPEGDEVEGLRVEPQPA